MNKPMKPHRLCRAGLLIVLLLESPGVLAYLDPSTGSMVVSALVGLFASLALAVKTYWYKLKNLFRRSSREPGEAQGESPPRS